MSDVTIPEDVMERALEVAPYLNGPLTEKATFVARAIMGDRLREISVDRLADIIATHMDLFYVAGAPPAGAKSAARAVLKAIRSSHE